MSRRPGGVTRRALALQIRGLPADRPEIRSAREAYAPVLRALGRTGEAGAEARVAAATR